MLPIITLCLGVFETNCMIFVKENHCYIIDPGDSPDQIQSAIEQLKLPKEATYTILLTHAHFDHIGAVHAIAKKYHSKIYLNHADEVIYFSANNCMPPYVPQIKHLLPTQPFENNKDFTVINLPGHTPGSVGIYLPDEHVIFTGDTLFKGSIGRTDFPLGDSVNLFESIYERLFKLPDETKVYSGHGDPTTIGHEKRNNPYLNYL